MKTVSVKVMIPLAIILIGGGYVVLAATVAPPFITTLVQHDKDLVNTRLTDVLAALTIGLPIAIVFVFTLHQRVLARDGKTPSRSLQRIVSSCAFIPIFGIFLMTLVYAFKAISSRDNPVWHFWAGQSVGMLGVFLIIVICGLWKLRSAVRASGEKKLEQSH